MRRFAPAFVVFLFLGLSLAVRPAQAADNYTLDTAHTGVVFRIEHVGLSWTYGRFNEVSGSAVIDQADPAKSAFQLGIKTASIDTGNAKRDDHLRSDDFFDVKQFGAIAFKSTAVKKVDKGLEVTGALTIKGVSKPVTFVLTGGKTGELPKGVQRIGYSTELSIQRGDFGVGGDKFKGVVGEEVQIMISFELIKQ